MSSYANQQTQGGYSLRSDELGYLKRSPYAPVAFILPTLLAGTSLLMNGQPWLTDLAFCILTAICLSYLVVELYNFPKRFGVGGLVLYGGVLVWFSHDYFNHWLGHGFGDANALFEPVVIAKATFCHCLFIMFMCAGLYIPFYKPLVKIIHAVPEPINQSFYLWLLLGLFILGITPYALFTKGDFVTSIWSDMWAMRSGTGARWTIGRTGNVNYSYGAYISVLIEMGRIGGQLAVFYALLVARNPLEKVIAWGIWIFWMMLAFGSGTRGQVLFMALPAISLLYLKYQSYAAAWLQRFSARAYVYAALFALITLFLVQFQGYFRTAGFESQHAANVSLLKLKGNTMFSEGLLGYALIPEQINHFYSAFPGESIVRPLPQTLFWFTIGPVPRALWTTKPIDPVWAWYNYEYTGSDSTLQGTTIAQGLVGYWYFRYGFSGIIQGGLLLGWLMIVFEKALQRSAGSTMHLLFSLSVGTWLFRSFRDLNFHELYPIIIGGVLLYVVIRTINAATMPLAQPQIQAQTPRT